jgi:hypothetical protein
MWVSASRTVVNDVPGHADHLRGERPGHARREEEGPERRADELVGGEEPRLQALVAGAEIGGRNERGQERLLRGVGEDLGDAVEEHRREHHGDADGPGGDEDAQHGDDHGPDRVGDHDDEAAVQPVGQRAGPEAEQEPRQPLEHRGERDQECALGLGRDEQGPGGERDAVADVAGPGRGDEPPE